MNDPINPPISADLAAELAALQTEAERAELSPAEAAEARALAQLSELKEQKRESERKRRGIEGARLERAARAEAAGRYMVRYFDLGALLPDADPKSLPGGGVLVIRSHPPQAKTAFDSAVEGKSVTLSAAFCDLVCASVVHPSLAKNEDGIRFRAFLESELGNGTPPQIGAAVLELGGARIAEAKRATR